MLCAAAAPNIAETVQRNNSEVNGPSDSVEPFPLFLMELENEPTNGRFNFASAVVLHQRRNRKRKNEGEGEQTTLDECCGAARAETTNESSWLV